MPNLKFLAPAVPEIWMGSKIRVRDSNPTPFDLILHFFISALGVQSSCQIEVSSSNRSRDIEGSQNFKSRSRGPLHDL